MTRRKALHVSLVGLIGLLASRVAVPAAPAPAVAADLATTDRGLAPGDGGVRLTLARDPYTSLRTRVLQQGLAPGLKLRHELALA